MKNIILLICTILLLSNCAEPNDDNIEYHKLGNQKIVIYRTYVAKYSKILFSYQLELADGHFIRIYGSNGGTGYYYKKYNLSAGDVVTMPVTLRYDGDRISICDIDFKKYQR